MTTRPAEASALLGDRTFVTDGGIETDLIHRRGAALPDFAAFPLLDTVDGGTLLRSYYDDYAASARTSGRALMHTANGGTPT